MAFLLYLLQINIALSLLYLCYKVLFSQNTFFGLRRLILISIVLFSTTYPWYDIPDIDPIIPAHLQITLPEVLYSMGETVPQKAFDIYPLIAYLYGGICSLFLLRMFLRIASIIKLRANGKLRIIGKSHIIVCDENIQPCSFFRWIFLPHSILQNKNTLTRILRHENTHIRQLHTIDVLLGESMAALCWINPLSWLLLKEIRLNLEYMADKAAIPNEQEKKTYQYLLLDISQSNNELPSAIPFNYSFLKTRIRMINRKRSQTTSVFKYLLILPLFLAIVTANQCCTDQQPLQSEIEKVFPKSSEVQTNNHVRNIGNSPRSRGNHARISRRNRSVALFYQRQSRIPAKSYRRTNRRAGNHTICRKQQWRNIRSHNSQRHKQKSRPSRHRCY